MAGNDVENKLASVDKWYVSVVGRSLNADFSSSAVLIIVVLAQPTTTDKTKSTELYHKRKQFLEFSIAKNS